jgi:hypothetical protein
MMVIEMRKAAQDKALDLLDEIKDLGYKKKMALCELEDTLHECFEIEESEQEDTDYEMPYEDEEKMDMDFRSRGYRRPSRRSMRHTHDVEPMSMRSMRRRMRSRMG